MSALKNLLFALAVSALLLVSSFRAEISGLDGDYCGVKPYPNAIEELPEPSSQARLIKVLNFIRHGDRAPTGAYTCWNVEKIQPFNFCSSKLQSTPSILNDSPRPNSQELTSINPITFPLAPFKNSNYYDGTCYVGQLSDKGHWMSYNNGRRVGRAYAKQWSRAGFDVNISDIQTRVTDVPRTKESAESFMTGFYDEVFGDRITSIDIPLLNFADVETDPVRLGVNVCPQGLSVLKRAYASEEYTRYKKEYLNSLEDTLKGVLSLTSVDVLTVFDCLMVHRCQNLKLPSSFTQDLQNEVIKHANFYWTFGLHYEHSLISKYLTGPLLTDIYSQLLQLYVDSLKQKITTSPKFKLYSGHDFGPMMNLLSALSLQKSIGFWPPYSAMLNLEIADFSTSSIKSDLYLRPIYQAVVVPFPFCKKSLQGGYCGITEIIDYLKPLLPTHDECPKMPPPMFEDVNAKDSNIPINIAISAGLFDTTDIPAQYIEQVQEYSAPLIKLNADYYLSKQLAESGHPTRTDEEIWAQAIFM